MSLSVHLFAALLLLPVELTDILYRETGTDDYAELLEDFDPEIGSSYEVQVTIQVTEPGIYYLVAGNSYMKAVRFFDSNGLLLTEGNAVKLNLYPGTYQYTLWYPFHDEKSSNGIGITWETEGEYLSRISSIRTFQYSFASVLIFLVLVAGFFVTVSKDRVYLFYGLYVLSILVFFTYQYGLMGDYIPVVNKISPNWFWIFSASITVCYIFFAQAFLHLKQEDPFCYRVTIFGLYFIALIVLTEIVSQLLQYDIQHKLGYKLVVLSIQIVLMILVTYRIYNLKTTLSKLFLLGVIVLLVTTLTGQYFSTFQKTYETNVFVQSGLLLEILILSIGIAVRVGLIQRSRNEAQSKLIEQLKLNKTMQDQYMTELELEVKSRTHELQLRNKEYEILLKEIHHRVKNNLQMITSLLNLQQRRFKEDYIKDILTDARSRVRSIGLVHEHLYRHDDLSNVQLKLYLSELLEILLKSVGRDDVTVKIDIEDLERDFDFSVQLGLIFNELVINALKHGLNNQPNPTLFISLKMDKNQLHLMVGDNGKGTDTIDDGFGWLLIKSILSGIEGEYTIRTNKGLHVDIFIKDPIFEGDENIRIHSGG